MRVLQSETAATDPFDRQRRIEWWRQDAIERARVMVVGAGALGNEALKNLVLLGFRNILVCDFDTIEISNLSRTVLFRRDDVGRGKAEVAARRAAEIALADEPRIAWLDGDVVWDIGLGVYRKMDVVLGCLDNVEARQAVSRACRLVGTPWVEAGIQGLAGHVSTFRPGDEACYECDLNDAQLALARRRYSCDNVRRSMLAEGRAPTVQIAAALAAAIQVQEAVKLVCGRPVRSAAKLVFFGSSNDFDIVRIRPKSDCPMHAALPQVDELPLSADDTLRAILETVSEPGLSGSGACLDLAGERSFVLRAACRRCGRTLQIGKPAHCIYDRDLVCIEGCRPGASAELDSETPTETETLARFDLETTASRLLDMPLTAIGVPLLHILPVRSISGDYRYYELGADRTKVLPRLEGADDDSRQTATLPSPPSGRGRCKGVNA